jgi:hypothetical protein
VGLLQKLGFIERTPEWPSRDFGPVLPNVLEELKRAYRILTTAGFEVIGDPLNPLGDGRSWVIRCEPTRNLPDNSNIANLAEQCLLEAGIKVAVKPVWDKNTLLVALWESGRVATAEVRHANSSSLGRKRHGAAADSRRLLRFLPRGDQITVASCDDMRSRIANTFEHFMPYMLQVKSIVRSHGGRVSVENLRKKFKDTHFVKALSASDWQLLIEEFSTRRPAGLRNLTVALLARRTGLSPQTVATYTKPSKRHRSSLK